MGLAALLGAVGWAAGTWFAEAPVFGVGLGLVFAAISWGSASAWGMAGVLSSARADPAEGEDRERIAPLVEGLRLAVGRTEPVGLYVVEDPAPNAFAVAKGDEAAIAVTRGLLDKLDKYELEGVLAHELAHIENGDSRLMVLVAAVVGSILMLSEAVWRSMRWGGRRRSSRDGSGAVVLVLLLVTLVVAPIAAQAIRFAVSRSREYLADATAVRMTRNPDGLVGALEAISTDQNELGVARLGSSHLWIWNPLRDYRRGWGGLFETHPPVAERISRLRSM